MPSQMRKCPALTSEEDDWVWYTSSPYPCPYLPSETARARVVVPLGQWQIAHFQSLLERGFRRSGEQLYAPSCPNCQACVSVRIPVARFQPNRSQRRTAQRLAQLQARDVPLAFTWEHYQLYQRYAMLRHQLPAQETSEAAYWAQLLTSPFDTRLIEFRDPDGVLRIVSVIDVLPDALSAVYTWYDPDTPSFSYGTYAIVWQINQARRAGMRYLYLGYWIAQSKTMAYKARFRPLEGFCPGVSSKWEPVPEPRNLLIDRAPPLPEW